MTPITIDDVINLVDTFKPNTRSDEEKILWLNDIDSLIKRDIIDTHEDYDDYPFSGYSASTSTSTPLLIPAELGRDIYRYYIEYQIDIINREYNKYNAAAALYQSALEELELYWHNHHVPLKSSKFHF